MKIKKIFQEKLQKEKHRDIKRNIIRKISNRDRKNSEIYADNIYNNVVGVMSTLYKVV